MNIFGRKGKKDAAAAKAAAAVTKELCQVLGVPLKQAVRNNPSFDGVPVPAVVRECLDYVGLYGLRFFYWKKSEHFKSKKWKKNKWKIRNFLNVTNLTNRWKMIINLKNNPKFYK